MQRSNHCFIIGNLGSDPTERGRTDSGPIIAMTVAENVQVFIPESKKYETIHTNWFNVTAFGSLGERSRKHLKKGDRVAVQGRMRTSRYTDKNGEERMGFEIVAEEIAHWNHLPSAMNPVPITEAVTSKPVSGSGLTSRPAVRRMAK